MGDTVDIGHMFKAGGLGFVMTRRFITGKVEKLIV